MRNRGVDKSHVSVCFGKALGTYDKSAVVQKNVADALADLMRQSGFPTGANIYEVGAGTGLMTARLVAGFAPRHIVANDLCADCAGPVSRVSGGMAEFVAGDAEDLPVPAGTGTVVSCSTIHWFENKPAFFGKVANALPDGGFFAFATYGPGNLREVRESGGAGLDYNSADEYKNMLDAAGFRIVATEDKTELIHFPDTRSLLRHFRETGVGGVARTKWDLRETRRFNREYERRFRDENGLFLTYHPLCFVCAKQNS